MQIYGFSLLLITVLAAPQFTLAKRAVPKPVAALVSGNVKYIAPDVMPNYRSIYGKSTCPDHSMCVEARNRKTGKLLWQVEVYQIKYDPNLEGDVQDIYISSLAIERDKLIVKDEVGTKFSVDLKTRAVTKNLADS
jgi:hypothetical protein